MRRRLWAGLGCLALALPAHGAGVLVEAESFDEHGGWVLDTQFIENMGSPYLLAHGLGRPVADAKTTVAVPEPGTYRVYVRTLDWVARWKAPGQPGRFQVLLDGEPLKQTFGTQGADWSWHDGGTVPIRKEKIELALHDLTGFDGRCDALWLTSDVRAVPPEQQPILGPWRQKMLGLPETPVLTGPYDLVVIGGGYAGMGAAISAARLGCKVALIQNRPVLGGNGSSEVRVWSQGLIRRGKFPRLGEIVEEFADQARKSPGAFEEFEDAKKEKIVRAEPNIDLFLDTHADGVELQGSRIAAVTAFDTRRGARRRFLGRLFVDCTGHGTIGYLAGADYDMTPAGRMGMSNMWRWKNGEQPAPFPETPWALALATNDFPYPRDFHGQWFWESGFDLHPIDQAEAIRDWNLRAVFGAFNAMKNGDGADQHRLAQLEWVAFVGGPRESRRLLGDVILSQDDIVTKRDFPDGCVPSTWSIDLHYPQRQYAQKYPDNPFISAAEFDQRVDRTDGYPVPYRCFYSRNVPNLFMAGRCISVTHEALGTVRVMKTCGMMGEVVGKAATVCLQHNCDPREVYERYWTELAELLKLPGRARRATLAEPIDVPPDAPPPASARGPRTGLDPASLPGVVLDDSEARRSGAWTEGQGLKGYVGFHYLYASPDSGASLQFEYKTRVAGPHEFRLAYQPHENRGTAVPVAVGAPGQTNTLRLDLTRPPPLENGWVSLGTLALQPGQTVTVTISTEGAKGFVHADALQILPPPQN